MIYFDPQLLNQLAPTPTEQGMFFLVLQETFLHFSKKESFKKRTSLRPAVPPQTVQAKRPRPFYFHKEDRGKTLTPTERICTLRGTPGERQTCDLGIHRRSVSTIVQVNQRFYWVLNIHVKSTRENSQVLP